jgi:hypothetical protein
MVALHMARHCLQRPLGVVVGVLFAAETAMRAGNPALMFILSIGIVVLNLVLAVVAILIIAWVIRSKSFLKPFTHEGKTLAPFVTVSGTPASIMPWSSAYGICWVGHGDPC